MTSTPDSSPEQTGKCFTLPNGDCVGTDCIHDLRPSCACGGLSAYSCLRSDEAIDEDDLTADDRCDCACHDEEDGDYDDD